MMFLCSKEICPLLEIHSLKTKLSANIKKINIPNNWGANMDSVTESDIAMHWQVEGGIGIIHRFMTIEDQERGITKRSESVIIEQPYTIGPK